MFSKQTYEKVLDEYGLEFEKTLSNLQLPGSPERCIYRMVVEDKECKKYFLESISFNSKEHKLKIIDTLHFLKKNGLIGINLHMKNKDNNFIVDYAGDLWQIQPFVENEGIDQTTFYNDAWRGEVLADFLIGLKSASKDILGFDKAKPHSLKRYIKELSESMKKNKFQVYEKVLPVIEFLEKDFFKVYGSLTLGFTHGDYHPINVLWGKDKVKAVIDWEFLGYNLEMYDVANMIGCVGMENPMALAKPLVISFISKLKKAGIYEVTSWKYLLELIISLRFAWLSEWLRKRDDEMVALELSYMFLLMKNREAIKEGWDEL